MIRDRAHGNAKSNFQCLRLIVILSSIPLPRTEALVLMKWSELAGLPFPFLEYKSILNPSSSVWCFWQYRSRYDKPYNNNISISLKGNDYENLLAEIESRFLSQYVFILFPYNLQKSSYRAQAWSDVIGRYSIILLLMTGIPCKTFAGQTFPSLFRKLVAIFVYVCSQWVTCSK